MILKWRLMCFYFISIGGLLIYIMGYFPIKISRTGYSSIKDVPPKPADSDILAKLSAEDFKMNSFDSDLPISPDVPSPLNPPRFTKLVLVVINALREDFVIGPQRSADTPFLHKALTDGNGLGFISRSLAPAVTIPRVKSLVTGSVPSYSDVILTLDKPKRLREDNFIDSSLASSKSIVFYGDRAWMRMFPAKFKRHEFVSSFNIRDFKNVDDMVTKHLEEEMKHPENFDILILNYLGLGHIGHVAGSKSRLIGEKLYDIDSAINTVYERLKVYDASKGENSLLVVTGDHGMTDKGNHGGTTEHERNVPLVFLSPGITANLTQSDTLPEIQQTDLAATLSALLGIPVPRNSLGQLIDPMIQLMKPADQLHALQYNCHHLLSLAGSNGLSGKMDIDPLKSYRDALLSHATWIKHPTSASKYSDAKEMYTQCQQAVSYQLLHHIAAYDYPSMAAGIILTWLGYIAVIVTWAKIVLVRNPAPVYEDTPTPSSPLTWGVLATLGTIAHDLSLLSSSFLEEEHQTWYFMTATFLTVLFLSVINELIGTKLGMAESIQKGIFSKRSKKESLPTRYRAEETNLLHRAKSNESVDSTWDFVDIETSDDENTFDRTAKTNSLTLPDSDLVTLTVLISAIYAHRILRAWNSTGIQNANEPDVGDWLNERVHRLYLALSHFAGLFMMSVLLEALCTGKDIWRIGMVWSSCMLIFIYRLVLSNTMSTVRSYSISLLAILTYCIIGGIILRGACLLSRRNRGSTGDNIMDYIISSVIVMSALLLRAHNIWTLVLNMYLYWAIFRKLWPIVEEDSSSSNMQLGKIVLRTTLCYWFGQMSYFSTGNSNSLATIDVSAGYVGISAYHGTLEDTIVRLLITFATYAGPIMWTMMCLVDSVKVSSNEFPMSKQSSSQGLLAVFSTFGFLRLTPVAYYLILSTAMRYHQFVWSVFAPKLIYETAATVIYGSMLLSAAVAATWIR